MVNNFIDELPFKFPSNIMATDVKQLGGFKQYEIAVYVGKRRKPRVIGVIYNHPHKVEAWWLGDFESVRECDAWRDVVHVLINVDAGIDLSTDRVEVEFL